jgi:ABC-2 type transport system permease protein
MMGYGTSLELVVDPSNTSVRAALGGLANAIASQVGAQQIASNAAIGLIVEQKLASGDMADLGTEIQQVFLSQAQPQAGTSLISYESAKVGDVEPDNPANWVIPGYLVMFTFFAAAQSASIIVRERQNNTLERLLAGSAKRETILGGMFAGTFARGLVQITVFWTVGLVGFKIDMGQSPLAVIILSVIMVMVSASFSIMLATMAKTEKSAGALAVLVSLVLAPLGGCWWPLFITPGWMQSIARLTPHGWATTGFNELMVFGADFAAVTINMLLLIGFAAIFALIAATRFRTSAV